MLLPRRRPTFRFVAYDIVGNRLTRTVSGFNSPSLANGSVTDSYTYDAFGEGLSHSGSSQNDFLFDGQQYDGASADYYLRARFYDETSGRFLSQDPFGGDSQDPVTLHRYLYAGDDPVDEIDPSGRDSLAETLTTNAIAIGVTTALSSAGGGILYEKRYGVSAINGAIVGAQLGFSFSYATVAGTLIPTTTSALFAGLASDIIGYATDSAEGKVSAFYSMHKNERIFLEGAANGALSGALGDSFAHPGVLVFGTTVLQDLAHSGEPKTREEFTNLLTDALTQGIVAESTNSVGSSLIDADGLARVQRLLPGFLQEDVKTYVTMGLGAVWGTAVGTDVKEYFDLLTK